MIIGGMETCPRCGSPVRHTGYPQCHFFECRDSGCGFFMTLDPGLTRAEAIEAFNGSVRG